MPRNHVIDVTALQGEEYKGIVKNRIFIANVHADCPSAVALALPHPCSDEQSHGFEVHYGWLAGFSSQNYFVRARTTNVTGAVTCNTLYTTPRTSLTPLST